VSSWKLGPIDAFIVGKRSTDELHVWFSSIGPEVASQLGVPVDVVRAGAAQAYADGRLDVYVEELYLAQFGDRAQRLRAANAAVQLLKVLIDDESAPIVSYCDALDAIRAAGGEYVFAIFGLYRNPPPHVQGARTALMFAAVSLRDQLFRSPGIEDAVDPQP
jgi:hypothetical protein